MVPRPDSSDAPATPAAALARGVFASASCGECGRDYPLDLDDLVWRGLGERRFGELPLRCPKCGSRAFEVAAHESIDRLLHEWLAEAICAAAREASPDRVQPPERAPPRMDAADVPEDRRMARIRLLRRWSAAMRDRLQREVTIAVSASHDGRIVQRYDPGEGTVFECSWDQAQQIHSRHRLILGRVVSPGLAYFKPARMAGLRVPDMLPKPPYTAPLPARHAAE
jgi:DNA-directed RNA polymerase subunit RPC12/RpoP